MKVFAVFILLTSKLFAAEFLVTTNGLTQKKVLRALADQPRTELRDHEVTSLYDEWFAKPFSQAELHAILSLERSAQEASLGGRFDEALSQYRKALEKLTQIPNVKGAQSIRLHVLIRIAELSELLGQESLPRWKVAHAWSPTASLSPDEFSPALIKKFESFNGRAVKLPISFKVPRESTVFINGNLVKSEDEAVSTYLEEGDHQISFLAPGAAWAIKEINVSTKTALSEIDLKPVPVVQGTCDAPEYLGPSLPDGTRLIGHFSECERVYDGRQWYGLNGQALQKFAPSPSIPALSMTKPEPQSGFEKLVSSPWFWIGTAAVVATTVAIVAHNQSTHQIIIPTKTVK